MRKKIVCSRGNIHYGYNIKRLREILGIKQSALAVHLGISQQAVSDMEKKNYLRDGVLEKVSEILNVSVSVIKNYDENKTVDGIMDVLNDTII
ncbi:MAG: helix-turn-helix transcriptional regulator [Paludibacter sp.]|nr:helix-turn-helix transcriptional regulator [Paludibacter sp.]